MNKTGNKKSKKREVPVLFEVVDGVEGPSLYMNDYRIAGPKPWGGGQILYIFETGVEDIREVLKR